MAWQSEKTLYEQRITVTGESNTVLVNLGKRSRLEGFTTIQGDCVSLGAYKQTTQSLLKSNQRFGFDSRRSECQLKLQNQFSKKLSNLRLRLPVSSEPSLREIFQDQLRLTLKVRFLNEFSFLKNAHVFGLDVICENVSSPRSMRLRYHNGLISSRESKYKN